MVKKENILCLELGSYGMKCKRIFLKKMEMVAFKKNCLVCLETHICLIYNGNVGVMS